MTHSNGTLLEALEQLVHLFLRQTDTSIANIEHDEDYAFFHARRCSLQCVAERPRVKQPILAFRPSRRRGKLNVYPPGGPIFRELDGIRQEIDDYLLDTA